MLMIGNQSLPLYNKHDNNYNNHTYYVSANYIYRTWEILLGEKLATLANCEPFAKIFLTNIFTDTWKTYMTYTLTVAFCQIFQVPNKIQMICSMCTRRLTTLRGIQSLCRGTVLARNKWYHWTVSCAQYHVSPRLCIMSDLASTRKELPRGRHKETLTQIVFRNTHTHAHTHTHTYTHIRCISSLKTTSFIDHYGNKR